MPTTDFDFVIDAEEPLPGKVINPLREALELRVPDTIDFVDWHRCSEAFREVAGPQRV
ncbi:MAG: nucleotidyltransferase domain-containing protein, partial [Prosthecobacter sp.]|nr:nucleotidyltransferase domain-containing protein [Prosthecobacter sp.]